jgi:hypothetical protein
MILMKMKNMMVMPLTRMTMIKNDKDENEYNNVLESKKNHFGTFAKNIFNLNIQYKTTNSSRFEYSDHIID